MFLDALESVLRTKGVKNMSKETGLSHYKMRGLRRGDVVMSITVGEMLKLAEMAAENFPDRSFYECLTLSTDALLERISVVDLPTLLHRTGFTFEEFKDAWEAVYSSPRESYRVLTLCKQGKQETITSLLAVKVKTVFEYLGVDFEVIEFLVDKGEVKEWDAGQGIPDEWDEDDDILNVELDDSERGKIDEDDFF